MLDPFVSLLIYLDSNVLVSVCLARQHKFLDFWRLHEVTVATSMYAVDEVRRHLVTEEQNSRFDAILEKTQIVVEESAQIIPSGIALPSKDTPILAAAISARANFLITGDRKHFALLYGRRVMGLATISPADFLAAHAYRLKL